MARYICCVDNRAKIFSAMNKILSPFGILAERVEDYAKVAPLLRQRTFDILIINMNIGVLAAEEILRQVSSVSSLPIYLIVPRPQLAKHAEALKSQYRRIAVVLSRPVTPQTLLNAVLPPLGVQTPDASGANLLEPTFEDAANGILPSSTVYEAVAGIYQREKTGILSVFGDSVTASIGFRKGKFVFINSDNMSGSDLRDYLIDNKVMPSELIKELHEIAAEEESDLESVLKKMDALDDDALLPIKAALGVKKMIALMGAQKGEYRFFGKEFEYREDYGEFVTAPSLLRKFMLETETYAEIIERRLSLKAGCPVVGNIFRDPAREDIITTKDEEMIFALIDDQSTLETIRKQCGPAARYAGRYIYFLNLVGAVYFIEDPARQKLAGMARSASMPGEGRAIREQSRLSQTYESPTGEYKFSKEAPAAARPSFTQNAEPKPAQPSAPKSAFDAPEVRASREPSFSRAPMTPASASSEKPRQTTEASNAQTHFPALNKPLTRTIAGQASVNLSSSEKRPSVLVYPKGSEEFKPMIESKDPGITLGLAPPITRYRLEKAVADRIVQLQKLASLSIDLYEHAYRKLMAAYQTYYQKHVKHDEFSNKPSDKQAQKSRELAAEHFRNGLILLDQRFFEKAEGEFSKAAILDPMVAEYSAFRAWALYNAPAKDPQEMKKKCVNLMGEAIYKDAACASAHYLLAMFCMEEKLYDKCEKELMVTLQLEPSHVEAERLLNNIRLMRRKLRANKLD